MTYKIREALAAGVPMTATEIAEKLGSSVSVISQAIAYTRRECPGVLRIGGYTADQQITLWTLGPGPDALHPRAARIASHKPVPAPVDFDAKKSYRKRRRAQKKA